MVVDWTTIIAGGVIGTVIGAMNAITNFILIRYLGKILDRIEKRLISYKGGE